MNVTLYPGTEIYVDAMHLNDEDRHSVSEIIHSYAYPETSCGLLTWVMYRIWNAVKSVFTDSDWQHAIKIIKQSAEQMAIDKKIYIPDTQYKNRDHLNVKVLELIDTYATRMLDLSLAAEEYHIVELTESMKPEIIDIETTFDNDFAFTKSLPNK